MSKIKVISKNLKNKAECSVPFTNRQDAEQYIEAIIESTYESGNRHIRRSGGKIIIYTSLQDLEEVYISTN